ncbi:MAG: acyl-CoA thioesterase [Desulfatirhabdiaceae bacterium]
MYCHRTTCRVIYADTDTMGYAYHANYFRWFEIGRSEMFRFLGLPYREIETKGIFLPVSDLGCRFLLPVRYDDQIMVETSLDHAVKGGMKFDYTVYIVESDRIVAKGYTRHACVNRDGKVVRPPPFLRDLINQYLTL